MKMMIGIPCMESIPTVTVKSLLSLNHNGVEFCFTMNSLIYDARNTLAEKACNQGFDRILFLDSDMVFEPDLYERLSARLDEGYDFVTGLYFSRRMPIIPMIYNEVMFREKDGRKIPVCTEFSDYPKDSFFQIKGCGFGGCMMSTKMLLEIGKKFGLPFSPVLGFGEDLSFCLKAEQAGFELYCDSTIKMGHMSHCIVQEMDYLKGE